MTKKCGTSYKCASLAKRFARCAKPYLSSPYGGPYGGRIDILSINNGRISLIPATIGLDGKIVYTPPPSLVCTKFLLYFDFHNRAYTYNTDLNFMLSGILYEDTTFQSVDPSLEFLFHGYQNATSQWLSNNGMSASCSVELSPAGEGVFVLMVTSPKEIDQLYAVTTINNEVPGSQPIQINRLARAIPCNATPDLFSRVTFTIPENNPTLAYVAGIFSNIPVKINGLINPDFVLMCETNDLGTPQVVSSNGEVEISFRPAMPILINNPTIVVGSQTYNGVITQ